jgi:hypothetical protein
VPWFFVNGGDWGSPNRNGFFHGKPQSKIDDFLEVPKSPIDHGLLGHPQK